MMKVFEPLPADTERLAKIVVDAAYKVHSGLGPGLLESVYEICLAHELRKRGLAIGTQVAIPVVYDGIRLEAGLRIDLLVEGRLLVEIKAVAEMKRVFKAQILTYLKLTGIRLGLLINFNVPLIKNGIERIILQTLVTLRQIEKARSLLRAVFLQFPWCLRVFVVKDLPQHAAEL